MINKTSKGEILLREYLRIKYHWVKHQYNVRPDWLKYITGNNLELDIFIPDLNLAFEFNGEHHLKNLLQKKRDIYKREKCEQKGIILYTFSLQTLHHYAITKGHTDEKYKNWFLEISKLLEDYRNRFKTDRTVSTIKLPDAPEPKNSGKGFKKSKGIKLPFKMQWAKNELKKYKNREKHYQYLQEREAEANKIRINHFNHASS